MIVAWKWKSALPQTTSEMNTHHQEAACCKYSCQISHSKAVREFIYNCQRIWRPTECYKVMTIMLRSSKLDSTAMETGDLIGRIIIHSISERRVGVHQSNIGRRILYWLPGSYSKAQRLLCKRHFGVTYNS